MKRLVQWLPVLILIPLWGGGLVLDRIAERVLLDSVHERLVTALHAHQRHVLTMLAHQQRGLELFAGGAVQALAEKRTPRLDMGYLTNLLPEVVGCVLLDAERRPVTRIGNAWPPLEEIATEFPPGTTESRVTDPLQEPTGPSVYDVYVPLKAASGGQPSTLSNPQSAVVGTLACHLRNTLSKALAEHREGLGLTGEVYLVDAETHLMLTESRFIPNAIGRVKVDTIGVREALKMRNGIAPYPDYRGIPVIGTFLYLRDYDWVLLAEMDETEALAPLVHLRMALGLSLVLISVVTAVIGWRYGRQLSEAYAEAEEARDLAQQGEAQVKALLRSMADAVFEIDESSTILIANESAHRMFGWPSGELIGRKATVLMSPEDRIRHETGLRRYLETGESRIIGKCIEVTGLRRDGSRFPCELSVAAMTLPDGRRRFIGVHRDVTERLQVESRNRMLAQAMRAAMEGIVVVDPQAVIIETNPAFDRMFGYERGELIGRQVSCLYPPAWLEKELPAIVAATRETGWAGEVPGLRKDGSAFPRWVSTSPIRDPEGRLIGMLSVSRDLTERKKAENELKQTHAALNAQHRELQETHAKIEQAKKEWEATFDAIADPLFIHDHAFRLVRANQAYADAAGMPPAELIGKLYYEVFPKTDGPLKRCLKAMEQVVRTEEEEEEEEEEQVPCPTPGKCYKTRLFSRRDSEGKYVHSIHVMEDITERKQMQDQASRMERLAALGQLLGGIAHELRNPLFIITGRLQLMKEMFANREYTEAERSIQIIAEAGKRMMAITQRFLQLSRPVVPRWERCSVPDVLTQMLDFLANELMKNRVTVVRSDAPDLPPTRSEPRQLHEVFLNIVMNAMQAMTAAHGHGTLTITTLRKDDWIETRIQDDGPGIAPRHRARLFEPFFSTKPPEQGTGLGLWTVRSILAELNGTVECESVEGQGTTFIIRIPIVSYPPKE